MKNTGYKYTVLAPFSLERVGGEDPLYKCAPELSSLGGGALVL